ncbi:unnamed protein product [Lactuca saligna]|uniref:Uncharacterized protein n=1 Tax=Lactuca saligna TaxID=75948 RepID=A0AA35VQC5_LACSI|nr:unnamed protein product [Lactuca saligna]
MEDVWDFDTIDVEVDKDLKKQTNRCNDAFLNNLCPDIAGEEGDDFAIPEIEHIDDDVDLNEDDVVENEDQFDLMREGSGSDEEVSSESDQDSKLEFEYSTHDPTVKWNKMRPFLGESLKLVAVCASDPQKFQCPFNVRASWMNTERLFQIKKLVDKHKCVRNDRNTNLMGPTWLGNQFLKELIRKPKLKCKEMQVIIQSRFHCNVSWSKCYRAKCSAMSLIEGRLSDHYAKVWDYGGELLRSNPGSSIKITVSQNQDNTTTFQRIYICFKAIKEGWKVGCRRVIGLDGSFFKGQCKGELLTAIGRDANNQVYPIAWAVVDIENKLI